MAKNIITNDDQAKLAIIKKNVKQSYDYFYPNTMRFQKCKRMIFSSSLTQEDQTVAQQRELPVVEFNILEAPINRLRGEFAAQVPDIVCSTKDPRKIKQATVDVIEGYIRSMLYQANSEQFENEIYKDTLGGGYSAIKVWTDYEHEESFNQEIYFGKVFDPTMCGWDPLARRVHKGDGQYAYECYPLDKDEFEETYQINLSSQAFGRTLTGFNWYYYNMNQKIVMVVKYYDKQITRTRMVKLSDGQVMSQSKYKKLIDNWTDFAAAPTITNAKWAKMCKIKCYTVAGTEIIDTENTDFTDLPIIFVDGNSVDIKESAGSANIQMTRSYVHHALDAQRFKNFAGQILLNEIETMMQHKLMLPIDGLPHKTEQAEPWFNHQKASTLLYNQYDNQGREITPPREVQHVGIPQEISQAFTGADSIVQNILGTFDPKSMNERDLSGKAIIEGATQNNSAAMPYMMNLMASMTQLGKVIVALIPKYKPTPQTIPIIGKDGRRTYQFINDPKDPNSVKMDYDPRGLDIRVEASTNFEVQKAKSVDTMVDLMKVMPAFNQMMNEMGMPVMLENIDIKGIEQLKDMARQWMQQQQQNAANQKPDPQQQLVQLKAQGLQLQNQKQQQDMQSNQMEMQLKAQIAALKDKLDQDNLQIERMRLILEEQRVQDDAQVEKLKTAAEIQRTSEESRREDVDQRHRHTMDVMNHHQRGMSHESKSKEMRTENA